MDDFHFGFPELPEALKAIVKLNEDQFELLRGAVSGPAGYDQSLQRCEELARTLNSDLELSDVWKILSSLRFLYYRAREWASRDMMEALREFFVIADLEESLGDDPKRGYNRLKELLSRNPALERKRKLRWLQIGILPTATTFASFVDIRPNFTDDRSVVEDLVPVVIFRVDTDTDINADRAHVFQLTIDGLAKLRVAVEDIEKKLASLRADKALLDRLHETSLDDVEDN